jgi:hypothetical protein
VRRRRLIDERSSSEGAHRKGADVGDARTESDAEEGSCGGKLARRTPGRWGKSVRCSGVDGRDERRAGEKNRPAAGGSLLRGRQGTTERGGGVRQRGRVGPGSERVPADRGPAAARPGGAPLFRQWSADAADVLASAGSGRESEERGARRAWAGPDECGVGRATDEQ